MGFLQIIKIEFSEFKIRYYFNEIKNDILIIPLDNYFNKDLNFSTNILIKGSNYLDCSTNLIAPQSYNEFFENDDYSESKIKNNIYNLGEKLCDYKEIIFNNT